MLEMIGILFNTMRRKVFLPLIFSFYAIFSYVPGSLALNNSEHILYGYPSEQGTVLYRKGYVLDYDNITKNASWVSYHLTVKYLVQKVERSNNFRPDPDLKVGERAELVDYNKCGYDRGHLVPAEDMRRDKQTESESFYLSNMTPQIGPGFNRGIWKNLEAKVRRWVKIRRNIYVIAGPIYGKKPNITIGPNHVAVPTSFYKIVVSCDSKGNNLDAIAFIFPNQTVESLSLDAFITTIDEVEKKTSLDFLCDLDQSLEASLESKKSKMW